MTSKPPKDATWHPVHQGGLFRAFGIDHEGTFWIAVSTRTGILVGAMCLTLAIVITTLSIIAISNTGTMHASSIADCHRDQTTRDDRNQFRATIYVFVDAARRARLAEYKVMHQRSDAEAVAAYRAIENSINYKPTIDCERAVDHPNDYKPPAPIPEPIAIKKGLVSPPPIVR